MNFLQDRLLILIAGGVLLVGVVVGVVLVRQPQTIMPSGGTATPTLPDLKATPTPTPTPFSVSCPYLTCNGGQCATETGNINPNQSCAAEFPDTCSIDSDCSAPGQPTPTPTATPTSTLGPTATPTGIPTSIPTTCPTPGSFNLHCVWDPAAGNGNGCYKINLRWTPVASATGQGDYRWELYENPHRPESGGPIFEEGEANQSCGTGGVCDAFTQQCTSGSYWARVRIDTTNCSTSWATRSVGCGSDDGGQFPTATPTSILPPPVTPPPPTQPPVCPVVDMQVRCEIIQ